MSILNFSNRFVLVGAIGLLCSVACSDRESSQDLLKQAETSFNTQDYTSAYDYLKPLAEAGDGSAQFLIGSIYNDGLGREVDPTAAMIWFEKAAQNDMVKAQYLLGMGHVVGRGVPQDYDKAFLWLKAAADENHSAAQLQTGLMYESGAGTQRNVVKAVDYLTRAAEQNNVEAQNSLGFLYLSNSSGVFDQTSGLKWLTKAADNGDQRSQYYVGFNLLQNEDASEEDLARGANYMQNAAHQGMASAQFILGFLHTHGKAVSRDICLLYTSPSPRDLSTSRMPSSA